MGIMAIGRIIVLSALVAQALSAPSGCIETCNFHETSIQQTSGSYRDHANLVQGRTHLNDHDYVRPGNWTEHNQYITDSGHGKVHEERGQYVEGSKKMRYYKKNFTSSYGTGNVNALDGTQLGEMSSQHRYDSRPSSQYIDSQSAHDLGQTVTKETEYNRMHTQQRQSLSTRIDSESERLEDFGEYDGHSQVRQHVPSINTQHVAISPDNWSRTDFHKTDGGHGQVFEEEGQYVTGPKKVRYYKKNYTSSYSSGVPQSSVGSGTIDELHSELQRNLQKDLDGFRRDFHQISSTGHTAATTHVGSTQEAVGIHDLQTAETDGYRQHLGYRGVPSTGSVHHYTDQQQRETHTNVRQQLPYVIPTAAADTYGTESHRTYQSHETHTSQVHPVPQPSHLSPGYVQVPSGSFQTSYHNVHSGGHHLDETRHAETLDVHQSNVLKNQLPQTSHHVYNPHSSHVAYPTKLGETRRYEEHWRSSSHTGGSEAPERTIVDHSGHGFVGHTERAHYDRDAYNEHRGRYHTDQGYESRARTSGSNYGSAYKVSSGQLVTGSLDLGHAAHGADCTEETHQQYQQHETRYHRKYKREIHHGDQSQHRAINNEDFTQQNQDGQETQQSEDLTQQSEQFTQQTQGSDDLTQQSGKLEFGQQTVDNKHLDDSTQQTEGQLEFGQQTVDNKHLDDLTQQTESQLEFGQQTVDNKHLDNLTQQNEQFTQQTEGQLEFGQQTAGNSHLEDLTQQNEQFTQQTQGLDHLTQQVSGKLEFGQQTIDNQHLDDLTQQSEQFTQQMESQLEFGQQTIGNPHLGDLTQQTESDDFMQQTSGKFEQQTDDTQQLEQYAQRTARSDSLTQQTQLGKHEFGQQIVGNEHVGDSTQQREQQTEGQFEFGQQINNQHLRDSTRQNEQFTQQTVEPSDFTQQSVGKLEFGQQTQSIDKSATQKNQHLEEFNEQNEDLTQHARRFDDFTQQTMGHIEFGQLQQPHRSSNHHLEDFTQQNEDLTQKVRGFDDFSQQTTGPFESEQQREQQRPHWLGHDTQRLQHYSQQNRWDIDNLSQQSHQYPTYNKNNEQSEWQLEQLSQNTNFERDSTQQTDQDHSAYDLKPAPKPKSRPRYQKYDFITPHTDGTDTIVDNVFKPHEVNPEADIDNSNGRIIESGSRVTYPGSNHHSAQESSVFDNQRENIDRLHWVHKSNDATVGLQWHYTYHPSDLTNVEGSHDNYYPQHNVGPMSQQTEDTQEYKSFHFNQQETQNKDASDTYQNSYISQSLQHDKHDQQSESFQQTETSRLENQFNQNSDRTASRVIPLQRIENSQLTSEQEIRSTTTTEQTDNPESRILQAYGGGPYDASRNDDFYNRVRPNPSVTLPPIGGEDPWDIREKPRETMIPRTWSTVHNTPEIVTEVAETTTQTITTTQPSFWSRVGHKITSTYDKAREKARDIFG